MATFGLSLSAKREMQNTAVVTPAQTSALVDVSRLEGQTDGKARRLPRSWSFQQISDLGLLPLKPWKPSRTFIFGAP